MGAISCVVEESATGELPLKFLLVEDNDLDVELVKFFLRRSKLEVPLIRAEHGEEGLRLITEAYSAEVPKERFVVLLDLNMPRMTGFEMLEQMSLQPWFHKVPVYICTTSDRRSDQDQAIAFGVMDYLQKPLCPETLVRIANANRAGSFSEEVAA